MTHQLAGAGLIIRRSWVRAPPAPRFPSHDFLLAMNRVSLQDKRNSRKPLTCSLSMNPDRVRSHVAMKVIGKRACGGFPATEGFAREVIAPRRIVQLHLQ